MLSLIYVPILLTGLILADYLHVLYRRRSLPPGPFPWPIVGNHFQTPAYKPWLTWEKWAQYYDSPMFTLWIGRQPRIILNDAWIASDLLEKKSDIFSSRPRIIAMGEAINATETNQTTLVYGDKWRAHRKLMVSRAFLVQFRVHTDQRNAHNSVAYGCRVSSCTALSPIPSLGNRSSDPRLSAGPSRLCPWY